MSTFEVIYLTGSPASGKTTLVKQLLKSFPNVQGFIYSQLLVDHLRNKKRSDISQSGLRQKSAGIVTPADIRAVDKGLINAVKKLRLRQHILIDSHAVTKENFGFRVTAFSPELLRSLRPTRICMLFTTPQTTIRRIGRDPQGRPLVSSFEANFHCFTQASLAVTYGILLGIPVYFYDSSKGIKKAFSNMEKRFRTT
jgi:adenylate kinase